MNIEYDVYDELYYLIIEEMALGMHVAVFKFLEKYSKGETRDERLDELREVMNSLGYMISVEDIRDDLLDEFAKQVEGNNE